ncbi:glycosyltransferase family 4 protein [Flavobacterium sp. 7A]|uniref:glycosyltransferase family 4 protein n=1 Tax=Flavobacterium sp. 7A TaxID=2940571 RepID=UPI002226C3C0|nr:glycosyltransferase family 4 protein [Flavobacterium sp. 7A]MCW2119440.1 glycosyltransferase involved in cell wall biosynthesis [Flavobacterium sp. 7A]
MKKTIKFLYNLFVGCFLLLDFYFFEQKKIKEAEVVCFFPFYHTGGAEKVHSQIVASLNTKKCVVVFTQGSATSNFLESFKANSMVIELNSIVNKRNLWVNRKLINFICSSINQSRAIKTIFSSNSPYFYGLLPLLNKDLKIVDLYHSFAQNDNREQQLIDSAIRINRRIVINQKAKNDLVRYYDKNNLDNELTNRIEVIENAVVIPEILLKKNNKNLVIGFVGRWSEEKRPEVYLNIVANLRLKFPEIKFIMAGSGMAANLEFIKKCGAEYIGDLFKEQQITALYEGLDLLLVPSVYEGFPMVIMEAMSYGVIPITTDVGGISEHITNGENGYLISKNTNEELVDSFCETIILLQKNNNLKKQLSVQSYIYAKDHFSLERFNQEYQNLLA